MAWQVVRGVIIWGGSKKEQNKEVVECCECDDYEGGVQDECQGGKEV